MCVIALAWHADPRWPLVLAANRDERHDRPTEALHRWPEAPHLLAGRDLTAGGTWLGVSEQGRLAALTNIRGGFVEDRPSRGELVSNVLLRPETPALEPLAGFNPFNLLLVGNGEVGLWSNRPLSRRRLGAGVYAFANDGFERPTPRTDDLRERLRGWFAGGGDLEGLLDLLADATSAAGGADAEPLFLRSAVYGTRCSTVVRLDTAGGGEIRERRFDADGRPTGESRFDFAWPAAALGLREQEKAR